jgi:hypothetical protein
VPYRQLRAPYREIGAPKHRAHRKKQLTRRKKRRIAAYFFQILLPKHKAAAV